MNRRYDILDSCDEPQFGSDSGQSSLEWEDVIRHAVLKSRSMGWVQGRSHHGRHSTCGTEESVDGLGARP